MRGKPKDGLTDRQFGVWETAARPTSESVGRAPNEMYAKLSIVKVDGGTRWFWCNVMSTFVQKSQTNRNDITSTGTFKWVRYIPPPPLMLAPSFIEALRKATLQLAQRRRKRIHRRRRSLDNNTKIMVNT